MSKGNVYREGVELPLEVIQRRRECAAGGQFNADVAFEFIVLSERLHCVRSQSTASASWPSTRGVPA